MDRFVAGKTSESALKPTVVFVPFFGGTKKSLTRHFQMVESLGYPWQYVDLDFNMLRLPLQPFGSRTGEFGMKSIWADQIEMQLNSIPGQKILYSFSNPSSGAIEAIARRNASDIVAMIADGGPTGEIFESMMSYFKVEKPLPFWLTRIAASTAACYLMEPKPKSFCQEDLNQFPEGFPILSVRGWKDPIITPRQIDLIFEPHTQIRWQKMNLPEAKHLNGLRDFKEDYEDGIRRFLNQLTF